MISKGRGTANTISVEEATEQVLDDREGMSTLEDEKHSENEAHVMVNLECDFDRKGEQAAGPCTDSSQSQSVCSLQVDNVNVE